MTIKSNGPAFGPAKIEPEVDSNSKQAAREHGDDKGIGNSDTVSPSSSPSERRERREERWSWPRSDVEDTDLERRVLAHERVLQSLIAHMAEAEPAFIDRLSAVFSDPIRVGRSEHDYTDTHAYTDRFIRDVLRLIERRAEQYADRERPPVRSRGLDARKDALVVPEGQKVTLLNVNRRAGIWEVTKDGLFYGHYTEDQPAFDAAEAVALAVVASGGAADVLWNDAQPQRGDSEIRTRPLIGATRTMEFRAGSTRVLR